MMIQKIFLSYSRADGAEFAAKLAHDLGARGFDIWIDKDDIRPGVEWDREIEKALEECDCLLYIETERSVVSNNVLNEVYYALEQQKKVIPLILVDSKTPFRLQRLQHIDFTKDYSSAFTILLSELQSKSTTPTYKPEESHPTIKTATSTRYLKPIILIIIVTALIVAAISYTRRNNTQSPAVKAKTLPAGDTIAIEQKSILDTQMPAPKQEVTIAGKGDAKTKTTNRNGAKSSAVVVKKTADQPALSTDQQLVVSPANVAGDWELVSGVQEARLKSGYLKIAALEDGKVSIKSYVQFYYFIPKELSYLNVFNAFTGCNPCTLAQEMSIKDEGVSIGWRTIKVAKHDQADGVKAGDTLMDLGANKSLGARITLHFAGTDMVVLKVQRTQAIVLDDALTFKPFVYTFTFRKREY